MLCLFFIVSLYWTTKNNQLIALIYRGPATCKGCPEAVAALLKNNYKIVYVGPDEEFDVDEETLSTAALYVQPGGGDLDKSWPHVRKYAKHIRKYVQEGGKYFGICLGAIAR